MAAQIGDINQSETIIWREQDVAEVERAEMDAELMELGAEFGEAANEDPSGFCRSIGENTAEGRAGEHRVDDAIAFLGGNAKDRADHNSGDAEIGERLGVRRKSSGVGKQSGRTEGVLASEKFDNALIGSEQHFRAEFVFFENSGLGNQCLVISF